MCMYEVNEHWKQYKQKKYQQCPAEKPGAMVLDEMIEAEEQEKELQAKIAKEFKLNEWKKEMDKFLAKLRKKNGQTKY